MDDRLRQHLETQLRNANAANHELRTRVEEAERNEQAANTRAAEGELSRRALEKAHFTQKAAEDKAAVARRKCEHAEHELLLEHAEIEKLRERLAQAQKEADRLHALEDRIAAAQHADDLFS
jgi:uncharacterized protein YhaN